MTQEQGRGTEGLEGGKLPVCAQYWIKRGDRASGTVRDCLHDGGTVNAGPKRRATGQVAHVNFALPVCDTGDEIGGLAAECQPTTIRCQGRRIRIVIAAGVAVRSDACQDGSPVLEVAHEYISCSIGIVGHQVAGSAHKCHVAAVRAHDRTGRCAVADARARTVDAQQ